MAKERIPIERVVAARVLFLHDRRRCVCRGSKPVQIHHIDDDPSNNAEENLAVLCFDCHRETQIVGGFDRKLDAEQVRLYREDWLRLVANARLSEQAASETKGLAPDIRLKITVAQLEIEKRNENWFRVADIYARIGDFELRDHYIELALTDEHIEFREVFARIQQDRVYMLPEGAIDRALEVEDWTSKARILLELKRTKEAALAYVDGIRESLEKDNFFTAAFYIKNWLNRNVVPQLFETFLAESIEEDELWWQVRSYEELGWEDAKRELLLGNERRILMQDYLPLLKKLAIAKNDNDLLLSIEKQIAEAGFEAYIVVRRRRHFDEKEPGQQVD